MLEKYETMRSLEVRRHGEEVVVTSTVTLIENGELLLRKDVERVHVRNLSAVKQDGNALVLTGLAGRDSHLAFSVISATMDDPNTETQHDIDMVFERNIDHMEVASRIVNAMADLSVEVTMTPLTDSHGDQIGTTLTLHDLQGDGVSIQGFVFEIADSTLPPAMLRLLKSAVEFFEES